MVLQLKWQKKLFISFLILNCFCSANAYERIQMQKQKIKIGHKTILVEVADTPEKASQGLMYRTQLDADSGMLFIFNNEEKRNFWMKNTFLDLSIGFFNKDKVLVDIQEMQAVKSIMEQPKSYESREKAQYVIEMNKNWFSKNKILLRQKFEFIK